MQITSKMQVDYLKYSYYLVQGRPFEVKEMFLEDILRTTGYTNKEMLKYKKEKQRGKLFIKQIKKKVTIDTDFLEYSSLILCIYKDTWKYFSLCIVVEYYIRLLSQMDLLYCGLCPKVIIYGEELKRNARAG